MGPWPDYCSNGWTLHRASLDCKTKSITLDIHYQPTYSITVDKKKIGMNPVLNDNLERSDLRLVTIGDDTLLVVFDSINRKGLEEKASFSSDTKGSLVICDFFPSPFIVSTIVIVAIPYNDEKIIEMHISMP